MSALAQAKSPTLRPGFSFLSRSIAIERADQFHTQRPCQRDQCAPRPQPSRTMIVWSPFCAAFLMAAPFAAAAFAPEAPMKAKPAAAIKANSAFLIGDFLWGVSPAKELADS